MPGRLKGTAVGDGRFVAFGLLWSVPRARSASLGERLFECDFAWYFFISAGGDGTTD